MLQTRFCPT